MAIRGTEQSEIDAREEEAVDARDAWLDFARSDLEGGAAALATAARHGRPLPRRRPADTPEEG